MSGGVFDYLYNDIRDTYEDKMEDIELNELILDLCDVLYELEWWKSGDTEEADYRKQVKKFKDKWLCKTPKERQEQIYKMIMSDVDKKLKEVLCIEK
jgi:hypothetical protein